MFQVKPVTRLKTYTREDIVGKELVELREWDRDRLIILPLKVKKITDKMVFFDNSAMRIKDLGLLKPHHTLVFVKDDAKLIVEMYKEAKAYHYDMMIQELQDEIKAVRNAEVIYE